VTPEELNRRRAMARAMSQRGTARTPRDIPEGISALGGAVAGRMAFNRANETEAQRRAEASQQMRELLAGGIEGGEAGYSSDALADMASNPFAPKSMQPVISEMMQRRMLPKTDTEQLQYDMNQFNFEQAKAEAARAEAQRASGEVMEVEIGGAKHSVVRMPDGSFKPINVDGLSGPNRGPRSIQFSDGETLTMGSLDHLSTKEQNDLSAAAIAISSLENRLDLYAGMVRETGNEQFGAARDAVVTERRAIQMQMKELFNLGVLNGPDLELMDQMLYDAAPSGKLNRLGAAAGSVLGGAFESMNPGVRATKNAEHLKGMFKGIFENRLKALGVATERSGVPENGSQGEDEVKDWSTLPEAQEVSP